MCDTNYMNQISIRCPKYFMYLGAKVRIKSDKQKNVAKLLADRRFRKIA